MDDTRYLVRSGRSRMKVAPVKKDSTARPKPARDAWMR